MNAAGVRRHAAGRRLAVLALAVLGVAALLPTPAGAATTRTLAITNGSAHPTVAFGPFDGNNIRLFDLDGDGDKEILAQNDNQYLYVFDARTGAILAQLKTTFPSGWGARSFNGPEAYREGGVTHIVQANSAAVITSWRFDAAASTATRFVFVKEWERRTTDCFGSPGMDSKPVLADLDRDGKLEILANAEESGVVALRSNGALYWKKCIGGGNSEPTVGDLNNDGWPDVVFASDGGTVTAMNGRTGGTMWSFSIKSKFPVGSGSMPVGPAVGQLVPGGGLEVVVGARDSHNGTDFSQDHSVLVALDSGGRMLWGFQDPIGNPLTYTHAVIADGDGDGVKEVYWGDWNTIGHKPPATEEESWKVTGPAHFYRIDASGNMQWRQTLSTFWSNKDVPLADVDGDGVQEMLANGPTTGGHDGIWYLDARTGHQDAFVDLYPYKALRSPVVGDLYGTGRMQWVVGVAPYASGASHGVLVYDTGMAYDSAWPGVPGPFIPSGDVTPPPPPPTSFAATFTIKSPNEWWQEMTVQATGHTIVKAEVRTPDTDWITMSKSSWGAWTSSIHTPAGTKVEFLVTDSAGAVSQSQPFTWMDGTTSKPSTSGGSTGGTGGGTGTGTLTVTFTPKNVGNDWWVETAVSANKPIVKVEASLNNGAWTPLDHTSWGTWAKSLHAPDGTQVRFRATADSGEQATSGTTAW